MSAHDQMTCGKARWPVRIYRFEGEEHRIEIHDCCPKCGQHIARKRLGVATFTAWLTETGEHFETQGISHINGTCLKCGPVEVEASYAE